MKDCMERSGSIGPTDSRLKCRAARQPVVVIETQAEVESEVSQPDAILPEDRLLLDVGVAPKVEEPPLAGEVDCQQAWQKAGIYREPRQRALQGIGVGGIGRWRSVRTYAWAIVCRIGQPGGELLGEKRMSPIRSNHGGMPPSRVSKFGAYTGVRQAARLRQCCGRVCEEIFGRPVTDLVLSHPEIRLAECSAVEGMQYGRRNIEAADRLTLVLPQSFLIQGVGSLEPGPAQAGVQLQRGLGRGLEIQPLDEILSVSVRVESSQFRSVEEPAAVDSIDGGKTSELRCSEPHIPACLGGCKGAARERKNS